MKNPPHSSRLVRSSIAWLVLVAGVLCVSHTSWIMAATETWDGGHSSDDYWYANLNWADDTAPVSGDALIFAGTTRLNHYSYASSDPFIISSITFDATAGAFVINNGGGGTYRITGNIINNSTSLQTIKFPFTLAGSTTVWATAGDIKLEGVISGGSLTKNGSNTLTLTGSNTFTGGSYLTAGTTTVTTNTALGTGQIHIVYGVATLDLGADGLTISKNVFYGNWGAGYKTVQLDLPGSNTGTLSGQLDMRLGNSGHIRFNVGTDDTLTLSGKLHKGAGGGAGLTKEGAGTLIVSSSNAATYTGINRIEAGTLQVGTGGTGGYLNTESITNNGTLVYNRSDAITISNVISGTGNLTQNGSGTTTLSGANTYTGATTVNAGTLATSAADKIADTSDIVINAGGTFSLGGAETVASISGAGNIALGANTLTTSSSSSSTFSGVISGAGGLTKAGSGTLTLSGTNTHSGSTTINAGTLQIDGNIANSGLVINSGGIISPGTTAAADSFGTSSITINGGGYNWTLNTANGTAGSVWDQITSTGALTSSGVLTVYINGTPGDWNSANTYNWDIISANSINSFSAGNFATDFSNFGEASGTGSWTFSNPNTGIIRLTYTPTSDPLWSGGAGNWSTGFSPALTSGGNATFLGASGGTATNNIASGTLSSLSNITFDSVAGAYTIAANSGSAGNGSALTVTGAITTSSSATQTINMDVAPGSISIDAGTLVLGASGRLNSGSYSNTIANSGTLIYSGTNAQTISGVISGTGALTKNASSTLTLSGANTYTGATTINAGTLEIVAAGSLGSGTYAGNIANAGTLSYSSTSAQTLSGIISGSGALIKSASSTLTLSGNNTYTGSTTLNAGALTLANSAANSETIVGDITINGGTLNWSYNDQLADTSSVTMSSGVINLNKNETLNSLSVSGGTVSLSNSGNTVNANTFSFTGGVMWMGARTMNTTLNGAITLGDFTFQWGANAALYGGINIGGNIAVNAGATVDFVGLGGFPASNGRLTLTGNRVIDVGAGAAMNVGWGIAGTGFGITKNGTGTLTLSGSNTYTGTTTINAGTLVIGAGGTTGSLSTSSSITVNGTLSFNRSDDFGVANAISGSGNMIKNASNTLTLSGNNAYTGTTTINAGTLQIGGAGRLGGGDYSGNVSIASGATFQYSSSSSGASAKYQGNITGAGTLIKDSNNGELRLMGNNTIANIEINQGILDGRSDAGSLGGAGTTISLGDTSGSANATLQFAGSLNFTTKAGIIVRAGSSGTKTMINLTGVVTENTAITLNDDLTINDLNALTLGGVISGTGGLTKIGAGTTTLSGSNTYSGGTTLTTGTLVIGNSAAAGSGTITQADGTSLLKFDTTGTVANAMSIYNVATNQTITLSGNITAQNTTYDVASGTTTTLSGTISGSGGITKNGTGTLLVTGNNSYNGSTVINAGTLNAANANALGSNNTVEVNGGTLLVSTDNAINGKNIDLGGSGIGLAFSGNYSGLVNNLTLSNNSIIDLGDGSVSIMFDTFVMSTYMLDIYNWTGNDTDKVYFGPDLSDAALAKIRFHSGAVGVGDSFLGSGYDLGLQVTSWDASLSGYHIIPVPEPETWATGILLLLGGAVWLWRKRKKFTTPRNLEGAAPSAP